MDYQNAQSTLDMLLAGAAGLWLCGALFVRATARRCERPRVEHVTLPEPVPDVTRRFAKQLSAVIGQTPLATARIESVTDDELHWKSGPKWQYGGTLRVDPRDRRRLTVELESKFGILAARIALTLGLIWTIAIYLVLRTWVLPAEHDVIRYQVWQMAQAIHGIWPPFLLAYLARHVRGKMAQEVHRIAHNLPLL